MQAARMMGSSSRNEMRVSAGKAVRPLAGLAIAPAQNFCRQLQQRYGQQAIETAAEMELRRSPLGWIQHDYHTQIQLAPRLQFTVVSPTAQPHQPTVPQIAPDTLLERQTETLVHRLQQRSRLETLVRHSHHQDQTETRVQQLQPEQTAIAFTELTDRLTRREVRIESVASPVPVQPPTEPIAAVQPVPQVLRQASAPVQEAIAPSTSALLPRPTASVPSSQAVPAVPIDVNRLTEQVIQTLDRRLLAYRERLGRV